MGRSKLAKARRTIFRPLKAQHIFPWGISDCRIRISDSRRRIVGLAILSDSDSDRIGILGSDSDSDFGLNPSDRIDEKLISDPTGNTKQTATKC